jgi:succinate-semialdehyde dehydrogenase/glutarate-semialdehyde dehydrogenase
VYTEEAFGPLGMIYVVETAQEAIELANSSIYGLGGTVFGDPREAFEVASRLDTGVTGVNTFAGAPVEVGFGGTKRSGVGRELGPHGMDAFSNLRSSLDRFDERSVDQQPDAVCDDRRSGPVSGTGRLR